MSTCCHLVQPSFCQIALCIVSNEDSSAAGHQRPRNVADCLHFHEFQLWQDQIPPLRTQGSQHCGVSVGILVEHQ